MAALPCLDLPSLPLVCFIALPIFLPMPLYLTLFETVLTLSPYLVHGHIYLCAPCPLFVPFLPMPFVLPYLWVWDYLALPAHFTLPLLQTCHYTCLPCAPCVVFFPFLALPLYLPCDLPCLVLALCLAFYLPCFTGICVVGLCMPLPFILTFAPADTGIRDGTGGGAQGWGRGRGSGRRGRGRRKGGGGRLGEKAWLGQGEKQASLYSMPVCMGSYASIYIYLYISSAPALSSLIYILTIIFL